MQGRIEALERSAKISNVDGWLKRNISKGSLPIVDSFTPRIPKKIPFGRTRFSDGSYPILYASNCADTTIYEIATHLGRVHIASGKSANNKIIKVPRDIYQIQVKSEFIDYRELVDQFDELMYDKDYQFTQRLGARHSQLGSCGLVTKSVRFKGDSYAIFSENPLSSPELIEQLWFKFIPHEMRLLVECRKTNKSRLEIRYDKSRRIIYD